MKIIVQKYGGSSLSDISKIKAIAEYIVESNRHWRVVVVVSAMGDTTDYLLNLAYSLSSRPVESALDMLLATGEQAAAALMAIALAELGQPTVALTGAQVKILTDATFTKAKILKVESSNILNALEAGNVVVVAGFQGVTSDGRITTLGRGGSDTTAVAIAAALNAKICEIYTDVDGVYTANPRIIPNAKKLDVVTYEEMLEIASAGAEVLQINAVDYAQRYHVILHIKNSASPKKKGTIIKDKVDDMEREQVVSNVIVDMDEAKLTILRVPDRPGVAAKIFSALAEKNINVDMIVQSATTGEVNDISFTVKRGELLKAKEVLEGVCRQLSAGGILYNGDIAKVSIVGVGMRMRPGIAAKMFAALASANINIQMISTSEIKISCIIDAKFAKEAVEVLHRAFELDR